MRHIPDERLEADILISSPPFVSSGGSSLSRTEVEKGGWAPVLDSRLDFARRPLEPNGKLEGWSASIAARTERRVGRLERRHRRSNRTEKLEGWSAGSGVGTEWRRQGVSIAPGSIDAG